MRTRRETWREWDERIGSWLAKWLLWRIGVPVLIAFTLPVMLSDIGPAWAALAGHGVHGTFTAKRADCSKTCFWHGDFVSDDGARHRADVALGSGGHVNRVGDSVPAVDTGDRVLVFPRGGGFDWFLIVLLLLAEVGTAALWLRDVPLRVVRWASGRHDLVSREHRSRTPHPARSRTSKRS